MGDSSPIPRPTCEVIPRKRKMAARSSSPEAGPSARAGSESPDLFPRPPFRRKAVGVGPDSSDDSSEDESRASGTQARPRFWVRFHQVDSSGSEGCESDAVDFEESDDSRWQNAERRAMSEERRAMSAERRASPRDTERDGECLFTPSRPKYPAKQPSSHDLAGVRMWPT